MGSAMTDTSARQAVAPVSDMHKLVAQAAAAAALKRQSQHQCQQQQHHSALLQQQLQSKSGLLLQQDAATQADLPPASQVFRQLADIRSSKPAFRWHVAVLVMSLHHHCSHDTVDTVMRCHNKHGVHAPSRGSVC